MQKPFKNQVYWISQVACSPHVHGVIPSWYCPWNDSMNMWRACHLRNLQHETLLLNNLVGYRMRITLGQIINTGTSSTCSDTHRNPVTLIYAYATKISRIVYTIIWLINTRALSGEEVALIWKITTRKYITAIGKVPRNSTKWIHNHVSSTYCIPECIYKYSAMP